MENAGDGGETGGREKVSWWGEGGGVTACSYLPLE